MIADYTSVVERIASIVGDNPDVDGDQVEGEHRRSRWRCGERSIHVWDDGSMAPMCRYVGLPLVETRRLDVDVADRWAKRLTGERLR